MARLREIKDEEIELMLQWRNAPSTRVHMYNQDIISEKSHFEWWSRTKKRGDCHYFMFEDGEKPLGIVAFTSIDLKNSNSSWAFYAAPDAPRGTGTRMEILALDFAFDVLMLHKLHCEVLSSNEAVIRLHQKFGFKVEGVFRGQFLLDEYFIDIIRLGILRAEWQQSRGRVLSTKNFQN